MNQSIQLMDDVEGVFLDAAGTFLQEDWSSAFRVSIWPDAQAILSAFKERSLGGKRIKTGVITNWSSRIHKVLKDLNLTCCFDVVVCSSDVSSSKPDPLIFEHACFELNIDKNKCLHIGDSFIDDALGAQKAGLKSLWLNRKQSFSNTEASNLKLLGYPSFSNLEEIYCFLEGKQYVKK